MPFADVRVTVATTAEQQELLKAGVAQAVTAFGKGESFLMVGIDDEYALWLGGRRLERGAYVSLSLVGDATDDACATFMAHMCELLGTVLDIPGEHVYVTVHPMPGGRWGWNGATF